MHFSDRALARLERSLLSPDACCLDGASPMPWLAVEQFIYEPLEDHSARLSLFGKLDARLGAPAGTTLVVHNRRSPGAYPELGRTERRPSGGCGLGLTTGQPAAVTGGLAWHASYAVPLEIVEYPRAAFVLMADRRVALALPVPARTLYVTLPPSANTCRRPQWGGIRRRFIALGAGLAIAAAGGSTVGVAAASAATIKRTHRAPSTAAAADSATEPSRTMGLPSRTTVPGTTTAPATDSKPRCKPAARPANLYSAAESSDCASPGERHRHRTGHSRHRSRRPHQPHTDRKAVHHDHSKPNDHRDRPATERTRSSHGHGADTGGAVRESAPGAVELPATTAVGAATPQAPPTTAVGDTAPVVGSLWKPELNPDPIASAQLSRLSALLATDNQPPLFLIPIYKAAGHRYHVPWKILAAINAIETDYGRNLNVSSAGAIGWMQFMPGTWRMYGMATDSLARPNPYNPMDAIFSAARYLAASGARHDLRRAIFAYNHAAWYVQAVLLKAQAIANRATTLGHGKGYSLPLAPFYMHQLGRTDDGVDIETAPDGALVYSITPGLVTAVADDPGGFGPNYPVVVATRGPLAGRAIYYGHVALSLVVSGQHVRAGQPIAVMGHTGDAASLAHGHIEIGFSNAAGDPLDHHGSEAWTPSGEAMRQFLVGLSALYGIRNS